MPRTGGGFAARAWYSRPRMGRWTGTNRLHPARPAASPAALLPEANAGPDPWTRGGAAWRRSPMPVPGRRKPFDYRKYSFSHAPHDSSRIAAAAHGHPPRPCHRCRCGPDSIVRTAGATTPLARARRAAPVLTAEHGRQSGFVRWAGGGRRGQSAAACGDRGQGRLLGMGPGDGGRRPREEGPRRSSARATR